MINNQTEITFLELNEMIVFGYDVQTDNYVYIDNSKQGAQCRLVCRFCRNGLIAKNGGYKRHHHFAHMDGSNCHKGHKLTTILMVKYLLEEKSGIFLPTGFNSIDHFGIQDIKVNIYGDKSFLSVRLSNNTIIKIFVVADKKDYKEIDSLENKEEIYYLDLREYKNTKNSVIATIDRKIFIDKSIRRLIPFSRPIYKKETFNNNYENNNPKIQSFNYSLTEKPVKKGYSAKELVKMYSNKKSIIIKNLDTGIIYKVDIKDNIGLSIVCAHRTTRVSDKEFNDETKPLPSWSDNYIVVNALD